MWVARVLKRSDEYRGGQADIVPDRIPRSSDPKFGMILGWHIICGWLRLFSESRSTLYIVPKTSQLKLIIAPTIQSKDIKITPGILSLFLFGFKITNPTIITEIQQKK